jgi:hypothetical protein
MKSVFWFSLQLLPETFLILIRTERDMIKYAHWPLCKVLIIVRFEFSRKVLEKFSCIKFHTSSSSGSRVVPFGRTDMIKVIIAFLQFCKSA